MFKKLILCNALLLFPASVFAATNIPDSQLIYTWGYGNIMNDMLQAVKGMTTEADYIIKAAMTIAFFIFAIQKAMGDRTSPIFEFGKFLLLYAVVYFFFLSPANTSKNQFMIHDEVTNKDYVVSRVPMGIGYTLSLMSRFEKVLLDGMEKHFSTPDSTAYSQAGLGFSLNAMMDLPTLRIQKTNPDVQLNINAYVKNCLQYDTLSGKISINDIHTSDELINVLFPTTNSKLTVYYENNNGQMNDSLISCGESAQNLKRDIAQVAGAREAVEAHIANVGTVTEWRNKFNGVSQIYFGQAKGAREQIQQMMPINALDDGINNTASVLGIDPNSLAANAAVAEQSYVTGMQAQGKLAQTYLPIAKAYLTAIIVGLSWLMAILSIMFGSYQYIKMFFVLCLSLVLWTPILSIINYLNDLTLQHTFAFVNAGVGAITYANYQEVFQAVTSHSSYLKYLVMLTPLLAFSLAKGSEMGFVSLASGLSQQLAGSARSASSFSTQQGLSTKTEISTPRGEEVYALSAGFSTSQSTFGADGRSFNDMKDLNTGTSTIKDNMSGNSATLNADGSIGYTNINGLNSSFGANNVKTSLESLSHSIQNSNLATRAHEVSNGQGNSFGISENDSTTIAKAHQDALAEAYAKHTGVSVAQAYTDTMGLSAEASGGLKVFGIGGTVSGSVSTSSNESESWSQGLSSEQKEQIMKTYSENLSNEIAKNSSVATSFNNLFKTGAVTNSEQLKSSMNSYTEATSINNSISGNGGASMVTNYINENLGGAMTKENVATAMTRLEQMAARQDLQGLAHYANTDANVSQGDLTQQSKKDFYSPLEHKVGFNKDMDNMSGSYDSKINSRNAPSSWDSNGIAGEAQRAAGAAKHKAGTAIEERDNKISDAYKNLGKM
ncbi:conjugal transfer protein TraG [Campylobacter sp. MIT 12-8780]|uniref:conjugal transfer protein TraG N-terminal domain-containing protein n=1 Tax=Campylobacter sp. MIT 12-8780 TaxID=2202200 RepID=UPI00115DFD8D|nr:conjugal transfer protein TraG N-terminal domain-containing protein [Campylobacter sp. MIT 12-8780]TQR40856.1 conjugal transfer protein TraG [Campylobacter sp. MIT 12-8780]